MFIRFDSRWHIIGALILTFRDSLIEAAVILSDTKWDHVGVVWNRDMSSLQVFIDGELKNDQTVSLPLLTNVSIVVHSSASEGINKISYEQFTISIIVLSSFFGWFSFCVLLTRHLFPVIITLWCNYIHS